MEWLVAHWQGVVDWFIRTFLVTGVGYNVWRFLRDRRDRLAKANVQESLAIVEGATVDNKIASSSITTLEASRVSMLASWEAERTALKGTISFQKEQLAEARERDRERDTREAEHVRMIQELRDQVAMLQERIRQQAAELADIADRLCELQSKPQDEA